MKPLFIILLLTGICFGQVKETKRDYAAIYMQDYKDYKAECRGSKYTIRYFTSGRYVKDEFVGVEVSKEYYDNSPYQEQIYIYYDYKNKRKPTLEGFIEFLRRRYK
jgi:hypothetical protein